MKLEGDFVKLKSKLRFHKVTLKYDFIDLTKSQKETGPDLRVLDFDYLLSR
jgi:hypothetical protein